MAVLTGNFCSQTFRVVLYLGLTVLPVIVKTVSFHSEWQRKLVEGVRLLTYTPEVSVLKLGQKTLYPEFLSGFPQYSKTNTDVVTSN